MSDYALARRNMVDGQIKTNKVINPRIIDAMLDVPRELFVPRASRGFAYVDEDISVGNGRYLVEPMVIARLLEAADVQLGDVVLDIGCATGYSTALLARLANTVVAVESDGELVRTATEALTTQGVDSAVVIEGPLTRGYPEQAPYQVILINGSVAEVPPPLMDQLGDGGRLVTVRSGRGRMGQAVLYQRFGDVVSHRTLFDAASPPMPGFEPPQTFEF